MTEMIKSDAKWPVYRTRKMHLSNWISKHKQNIELTIRNPTIKETFVKVIKQFKIPVEKELIDSNFGGIFSKMVTRVHCYLNFIYKCAGKETDIMI